MNKWSKWTVGKGPPSWRKPGSGAQSSCLWHSCSCLHTLLAHSNRVQRLSSFLRVTGMMANCGPQPPSPVTITATQSQLLSEAHSLVDKCNNPSLTVCTMTFPLFPSRGGVYSLSFCIWAKPVTCFNKYSAVEVMQCDF